MPNAPQKFNTRAGNQGHCFSLNRPGGEYIKSLKNLETYADKINMMHTQTFHKIRELLDNPKTTAEDLAEVIVEDEAFAESIMHFIKSFGFPPKSCTLANAVSLLGFDAIRSMVTEHLNQ